MAKILTVYLQHLGFRQEGFAPKKPMCNYYTLI